MTFRLFLLVLGAGWLLGGCLPGEEDVARKYNAINQRAAIENVSVSLSQAANDLAAFRVASRMRRKSPLDEAPLTGLPTVGNTVRPAVPPGVAVRDCGKFGALAYFTAVPPGVGNLLASGPTMAAALREKFGAGNVGLATGGTVQVPPAASSLEQPGFPCGVGSDIAAGSPIFVAGFALANPDEDLPDPSKSTFPSLTRDITVACPSGMDGVVKRKQNCSLVLNDDETETEEATFRLGNANAENEMVENEAQRLRRFWRCTPGLGTTPAPPTAAEIAQYCRDPANDLTKPPDDPIELSVDSLKKILETGSGNYTFKCKRKRDGSNDCDAAPYEGPTATDPRVPDDAKLRCDKITVPPLFVTNPARPIQLNGSLEIIGDPAATLDCGRGWSGALTARYQVRRCQMVRTVNGVDEPLDIRQTIWHIAYVAAQCTTEFNYRVQCPVGDRGNTLPITRRLEMLKPVALEWSPPIAGVTDWSRDEVATNDSRAEVKDTAAAKGFVVPDLRKSDLDAVNTNNIEWSLRLADGMSRRDPSSIRNTVTNCNNAGVPCGYTRSGGDGDTILVVYDTSQAMKDVGALTYSFDTLECRNADGSLAAGGKCHALLGIQQGTCPAPAQCVTGPAVNVFGNNFVEQLLDFNNKIVQPSLPPGVKVEFRTTGPGAHILDDANTDCSFYNINNTGNTIVFGAFSESFNGDIPMYHCAALNKNYTRVDPLLTDVINQAKTDGKGLNVYVRGNSRFSEPAGTKPVTTNLIDPRTGEVTNTLANWIKNAKSNPVVETPTDPCAVIQ